MSDSSGFIHDPEGIDEDKLAFIMYNQDACTKKLGC
jgi:hypothetical protein